MFENMFILKKIVKQNFLIHLNHNFAALQRTLTVFYGNNMKTTFKKIVKQISSSVQCYNKKMYKMKYVILDSVQ